MSRKPKLLTFAGAARTITPAITSAHAALPDSGVEIVSGRTTLLITDPQNDFLSLDGVTWGVVGKKVVANKTLQSIEALFRTAKSNGMPVFVLPHYCYPTDHGWQEITVNQDFRRPSKREERQSALARAKFIHYQAVQDLGESRCCTRTRSGLVAAMPISFQPQGCEPRRDTPHTVRTSFPRARPCSRW